MHFGMFHVLQTPPIRTSLFLQIIKKPYRHNYNCPKNTDLPTEYPCDFIIVSDPTLRKQFR